MKYITVLGSTGSIGNTTLRVITQHPDKFSAFALVSKNNVFTMTKQCLSVCPKYVCMTDSFAAQKLKNNLDCIGNKNITVLSGNSAACELASLNEIDTVVSAISGISGLLPTISAIRSGKRVLLANKEILVASGKLFMQEIHRNNSQLLPIDSEHNAIFQCLPVSFHKNIGYASLKEHGISRIILTASGGPLRNVSLQQLSQITPKMACQHPNWTMGTKISVDSATMMNKGLEYIEARLLFNASDQEVEIVLHPESIVHSMINYDDGSNIAQLSLPDMRTSIAYALSYPKRIQMNIQPINFSKLKKLTFNTIDNKRYPCLQLAISAFNTSHTATIVLNAANEIAVKAFLNKKISFVSIPKIIQQVLDQQNEFIEPKYIEEVLSIDQQIRHKTISIINKLI